MGFGIRASVGRVAANGSVRADQAALSADLKKSGTMLTFNFV
jgi:hypothetical protein